MHPASNTRYTLKPTVLAHLDVVCQVAQRPVHVAGRAQQAAGEEAPHGVFAVQQVMCHREHDAGPRPHAQRQPCQI